jgi:large subunit ribosomal protein L10e
MAKLRKFSGYKGIERPYTRKSKYRAKSYVRASPSHKIVRFDMGNAKKKFSYQLLLKVKDSIQIRHNAMESARQTSNRLLEKKVGKTEYHLKIRKYPHHILRENPLASGAGADRMSTGMKKSFGKPIGVAAQFKKDDTIMSVGVEKQHIMQAKEAMIRAKNKFPCSCSIVVVENN